MPLDLPAYLKIVRASAAYDLLLTAPFATPWTFEVARGWLSALNQALGGNALAPFAPVQTLFACMFGSMVVVWAVLRLAGPRLRYGRADAACRLLFALWMAWALAQGGAPLLWGYLFAELALAAMLCRPVAAATSRSLPSAVPASPC